MTERSDPVICGSFYINAAETALAEYYGIPVTYSVEVGRQVVRSRSIVDRQIGLELARAALEFEWKVKHD